MTLNTSVVRFFLSFLTRRQSSKNNALRVQKIGWETYTKNSP